LTRAGIRNGTIFLAAGIAICVAGCNSNSPPEDQPVQNARPGIGGQPSVIYRADVPKPLPDQTSNEPPPPAYDDPALIDQKLPEEAWFVSAYNGVGKPRIAIFVNRTLDGSVVGESTGPIIRSDTERTATGRVDIQSSSGQASGGWNYAQGSGQSDSFKTTGPAQYHESTEVYLQPGQYDDASMSALDYSEMESLISDWMQADGQVTLISPSYLRAHLSDGQMKDLQDGKASGLDAVAKITGADIFVQVQAHPAKRGDQVILLLVAEAINIQGGESLAHASVEMPTPVDRTELNNYTRFLTRKLIHGMVQTWSSAPPPAPTAPAAVIPPSPPPAAPAAAPQAVSPATAPSTRP
jgi:hypothetical protein